MAESIQEIFKRKLVPVGFQRTMGLLGATTLGIGALMGAGIYVLIGLAAGYAGPAVWFAYLVCGLLSLLSVAVFAELSRKIPVAGGGYAFAYNALGSFWGFMTGWLLALGSIFACAMYATGFAYYFGPLLPYDLPGPIMKAIALVIIAALTALNCRGTKRGDRLQKIFTWGNLMVLLILIVLAAHKADLGHAKPMFPRGLAGVGAAISIIYVSFFGYQLIANNSEEIVDPEKTVPKAMLLAMIVSLTFYVAVALVAVMLQISLVCGQQDEGQKHQQVSPGEQFLQPVTPFGTTAVECGESCDNGEGYRLRDRFREVIGEKRTEVVSKTGCIHGAGKNAPQCQKPARHESPEAPKGIVRESVTTPRNGNLSGKLSEDRH